MTLKAFKELFGSVATAHKFAFAAGGWYLESPVVLLVLDLQKSNFGNYYDVNVKLFFRQSLPSDMGERRNAVKRLSGDIFRRLPDEYRDAFDLDAPLSDSVRRSMIERAFCDTVDKIVAASVDAEAILRLRDEGVLYLLPSVEARLRARR